MSVFKPVEREINFPKREEFWARFWSENQIFEKQLAQCHARAEADGKPTYVFFEGPPTANGMPHPGHVLTRVVKDLFPRFRAMQGYDVPRKAGWDTHGLPVEIEVEKELGIEGKADIEAYGVEAFTKKCKDSVFTYSDAWRQMTDRIAFWIDMDDPYVTYHQSYIESVWWSLKQFWDAGMLYHGHKIVPWCCRCGTALSSHEVGQGYKEVDDPSAFVAFRSKDDARHSFLAWTTTPWTLLSNVALAVGADYDYTRIRIGDDTMMVAEALRETVLGKVEHEVLETVKGVDLIGQEYEQLFTFETPEAPAFRIVEAAFVGLDAGTGIVHMAPAFGEDDYRVGQENGLPMINLVNPDGTFCDAVEPWKGMWVKEADKLILKDLKERGQLLRHETYKHDYPYCWRCDQPLLYFPRPAWYIRTSQYKEKMLANNAAIEWFPEHIQSGRFGNFLETNIDWALSRERFWGTPLPIWECASCEHKLAVGSEKELHARARAPEALAETIELHKPYVDDLTLRCPECDGAMKRVPEVIDCWYDSGSMPFAQWGYPHTPGSEAKLRAAFPADFISEAIDQTRGWFYTLLAISTLLKECAAKKVEAGEPLGELAPWAEAEYPVPYKRCLVMGHVCDERGYKMSKSKKNYLDPWDILNADGADAMRWYFYSSNNPWTSVRFFEKAIRESQRDFLIRLRNVYSFFVIYANIDGFNPAAGNGGITALTRANLNAHAEYPPAQKRSLLDRWMISKLEMATRDVTTYLEAMNILAAARTLYDLVDMLSNWYLRRSRDRFWSAGMNADKCGAYWTLYETLAQISALIAPFTPFFAEELYQTLGRDLWPASLPESIHLCAWPAVDESLIDTDVEAQMDLVREIASLGLSARAAEKLKVRQPLAKAVVILSDAAMQSAVEELLPVIKSELNVKAIEFAAEAETYVQYIVKPNFKALGPKLGKNMKACAGALAKTPAEAIIRSMRERGSFTLDLNGEALALTDAELDVRINAKDGFAAADGRSAVVVLDTALTPELIQEGIAREVINRIQTLRKDADLAFEARITLTLGAGGALAEAISAHRKTIAGETLCEDLTVTAAPVKGSSCTVEGQDLTIQMDVVV